MVTRPDPTPSSRSDATVSWDPRVSWKCGEKDGDSDHKNRGKVSVLLTPGAPERVKVSSHLPRSRRPSDDTEVGVGDGGKDFG